MQFSKRTGWNRDESELAAALRRRVGAGLPVMDLTASNPTQSGLAYDPELLHALIDPDGLEYRPEPKGSRSAREAVSRYYGDGGIQVDVEQILLTTSTSEAYGYLFKLLCNPFDEIVTPRPSYPLFEFLADAEAVTVVEAALIYDFGWQIDLDGLRKRITAKTRALVLVHPNNPTGHFTKVEESRAIAELCREFGIALIVDEVFLDYRLGEKTDIRDCGSFLGRVGELGVLTFVVSGLSKVTGLPQMKVAWLVAAGPGAEEAIERLEVLADTYLSVNTPMQLALPRWLNGRGAVQRQIGLRTEGNLKVLDDFLSRQPQGRDMVNRLRVEGGWYAILRVPATQPDDKTVLELLNLGVWVQPGYFYGFGYSGWLVVSLLTEAEDFSAGVAILLKYFS